MPIYWEQSANGVHGANSNIEEDNKRCEIQKPQMKNVEDKEQIIDSTVNIVFIFDLHMNNNCKTVRFGMLKSKDDMLGILAESATTFIRSSRVFAQSLKLWAQSVEKSIQSPNVLSQLVNKQAQSTEGVQGEQSGVITYNARRLQMWSNWMMKYATFIHNDDGKCFHMVIQGTQTCSDGLY